MRLLFAAAEMFPFSKSGGLADIAHALPKALAQRIPTISVTPLYRSIDREAYGIVSDGEYADLKIGERRYRVEYFRCEYAGVTHRFVYNETLCDRRGLYGDERGDYRDNDVRFAIFCHAIVDLALRHDVSVLHLNDWHTALAAPILRDGGYDLPLVFTIHNLAYQGIFAPDSLGRIGLSSRHMNVEDMEFYGKVNWLKGAIAHADAVTTVSPTYAQEIQTQAFGCGLDGFLRKHARKIRGILNGIDTTLYDPWRDPAIPCRYDAKDPAPKQRCKRTFLDEIDIKKYELPLFIFIGRFVEQKGIDLLIDTMEEMARKPLILAILGEGESRFHEALDRLAPGWPNVWTRYGYDEALSHRMYAAADFLLMPSRFEPCGLNQMISMRYGAVPVVHRTGGLADTVHPIPSKRCGQGIVFERMDPEALQEAIDEALELFDRRRGMRRVCRFDMACDFSIERCAASYLSLYRGLV